MPFAWAAGIAAVGGIATAAIGSSASHDAASKQASAAAAGQAQQQKFFDTMQGNLKPYMDFGKSSLGPLQSLLGQGPNGSAGMLDTLKNYPGYQFALEQGMRGVTGDLATKGLANSGQQIMGAEQYGQGMAGSLINQYFQQLMQSGQMGANAAAGVGQAGIQTGQGIANSLLNQGQAQASGIMGGANAWNQGIGGALNNAMQGYWMSQNPPQSAAQAGGYAQPSNWGAQPTTTMGDTSFMSDPAAKTDTSPANDNNLLRAVRNMPTSNYRYRSGFGDNGAQPRVGPMADDFAREVGGDGKVIPMPRMIGTLHGAVRSLADQVDELRRAHG